MILIELNVFLLFVLAVHLDLSYSVTFFLIWKIDNIRGTFAAVDAMQCFFSSLFLFLMLVFSLIPIYSLDIFCLFAAYKLDTCCSYWNIEKKTQKQIFSWITSKK